jgi:L-amino acid N-acyltransferase YncA
MTITKLLAEHWPAVKAIYEEDIATGNATFPTEAPEWSSWDAAHLPHSRLVALSTPTPITSSDPRQGAPSEPHVVLGWAALSPVSSRPVYAGVAEVSVYITAGQRGRKFGECLLGMLIAESEQHGVWRDTVLVERRAATP